MILNPYITGAIIAVVWSIGFGIGYYKGIRYSLKKLDELMTGGRT